MKFTKMHGLGNDYVYVWGIPENPNKVSLIVSERHFAIGSDGLITISESNIADFEMHIYNADGSEAMMCGNGIRCVGKYVYDKGYTNKEIITVNTLSGIKTLKLNVVDGKVESVAVEMGKAIVSDNVDVDIDGQTINAIPVNVGNPHAVVFVEDCEAVALSEVGPQVEHHSLFPDGVNNEYIQVLDRNKLRMRVWERGSGITMACGTGACASASAAVSKGYCDFNTPISVQLDGGTLQIEVAEDYSIIMTGPAAISFEGETDLC